MQRCVTPLVHLGLASNGMLKLPELQRKPPARVAQLNCELKEARV